MWGKKIFYKAQLQEHARRLRKEGTLSEVILWNHLKSKKVNGFQFLRQKPIDNFIVDFFCKKLKLVIEIDGSSHNDTFSEDLDREKRLERLGLTVIRFSDSDVKTNIDGVIESIREIVSRLGS